MKKKSKKEVKRRKMPKETGGEGMITGSVAIDEVSGTCSIRDPVPVYIKTAIDGGSGAGDLRNDDVAAA